MNIQTRSVIIYDDYGFGIEVKPREKTNSINTEEIKLFFNKYRIIGFWAAKTVSEDIRKDELANNVPKSEKEKRIELAGIPNSKQRLWLILHEMPDEITQKMWIDYMASKMYSAKRIGGISSKDFRTLVEMGKLQKIKMGLYKIINREIYKDDEEFAEQLKKLKSGEKIQL